jgi:hypothetical protein
LSEAIGNGEMNKSKDHSLLSNNSNIPPMPRLPHGNNNSMKTINTNGSQLPSTVRRPVQVIDTPHSKELTIGLRSLLFVYVFVTVTIMGFFSWYLNSQAYATSTVMMSLHLQDEIYQSISETIDRCIQAAERTAFVQRNYWRRGVLNENTTFTESQILLDILKPNRDYLIDLYYTTSVGELRGFYADVNDGVPHYKSWVRETSIIYIVECRKQLLVLSNRF